MTRIPVQPLFPFSGDWLSMRFTTSGAAVIFPCVFSVSHFFHTSTHLSCFVSFTFFFLCSFLLSLWYFPELLEEKDTMHLLLLSHGVWAKLQVSCWWLSLLLKPCWHSFILAFFRNRSRAVIQRPLGHLSFGSGVLYPLSSHLACAYQAVLSSTHSSDDGPFSATEKRGGISALLPAKDFHNPFI